MLCTFILHLIFFLFLILYPQHTPRLREEMVVLSFLLSFTFILVLWWLGFRFSHSLPTAHSSPGRVCVLSFLLSFTFILVLWWLGFRFSHTLPTALSSPMGSVSPYSLASYTMLPSHIVIITLPFSLLPSQRLFDDLLLVFSYVQFLLGSNTTTSATPSSFTAPPSKL